MDNKIRDDKSIAMRVSVVSIIINTILSIGKEECRGGWKERAVLRRLRACFIDM